MKEAAAKKIVVVIPTLNEEQSIGSVLDEVHEVMKQRGYNYEILVVDGRSKDRTVEIAEEKGAKVIYQRRKGYGDALQTGFYYAKDSLGADVILMMDGDGSYDPKDIPKLVEPVLKDQADLVTGDRLKNLQKGAMPFKNYVGNKVLAFLARLAFGVNVGDSQCGMRAFKAEYLDYVFLESEGMPFAMEMLGEFSRIRSRILSVPINYRPRIGKSKLNPFRDFVRIVSLVLMLARDYRPLMFFGTISAVLLAAGFIIGIGIIVEWLQTGRVVRHASTVLSSILIISGLQVLILGLIADMVNKILYKMASFLRRKGS